MTTITMIATGYDMHPTEVNTTVDCYLAGRTYVLPESLASRFIAKGVARMATPGELAAFRAEAAAKLAKARPWLAA